MERLFRAEGWITRAGEGGVQLRSAGDRTLLVRALKWGEVAQIVVPMVYNEWFIRGSVALTDRPVFAFNHIEHGGIAIGDTFSLYDNEEGLFAYVEVYEGTYGDFVLERVDRGTRLATSIGFKPKPHGSRIYDGHTPGIRREAVEVFEIAVVAQGAYGSSRVLGRRPRPSNTELAALALAKVGA